MSTEQIKIGILASGQGSNIAAVHDFLLQNQQSGQVLIALVIANKPQAGVIALCEKLGLPCKVLRPDLYSSREDYDVQVAAEFLSMGVRMIALCGYTRVLSNPLLVTFRDRILNVHPSLLPAFGGKGMYGRKVFEAILARGVQVSGSTVHLVTEEVDGGPILFQSAYEIDQTESIASLKSKTLALENQVYPEIIFQYACSLAPLEAPPVASKPQILAEGYQDDSRKEYKAQQGNKKAYALCDIGLVRGENADTVFLSPDLRLFGVADGVGSAAAGRETSRLVSQLLMTLWEKESKQLFGGGGLELASWLRKAVYEANAKILEFGQQGEQKLDLGSTLVASIYDPENDRLYITNTGDSRAYLYRDNVFYRLTRDHSDGYNPDSGEGGGLIYYIGGEGQSFNLDLFQLKLHSGDRVLLCSDGLLYAGEENVAIRLDEMTDLAQTAQLLLDDVYKAGAPDNTSLVLFTHS